MLWYTCYFFFELELSKTVVDAIWEQIDPHSFMERHSLIFHRISVPGWTSRGEHVENGIVSLHFLNGRNNLRVRVCYTFNENNIPVYRSRVTGRRISRKKFVDQLQKIGRRVPIYDRLHACMLEKGWKTNTTPFSWVHENPTMLAFSDPNINKFYCHCRPEMSYDEENGFRIEGESKSFTEDEWFAQIPWLNL